MIRHFVSTAVLAVAIVAPTLITPATAHAAFFHNGSAPSSAKVKNVKMTLKTGPQPPWT